MTVAKSDINALVEWLTSYAWPLWRDHGADHARAGFHESLEPITLTCGANFRRLRVATRQTHVFARAAHHGLPGAEALVGLGLHFLARRARQPDGGYAWRFDLDGTVIDQRRDLYDHAFVLLALSTASSLTAFDGLAHDARALLDWIDAHMRHPAGGYVEALPLTNEPRRQNPHMHLLEACLAAWDAFADDVYLARADDLVRLFLTRLYQPRSGTLPEFFDDQLRPQPGDDTHEVEPGHHAEWIWLLDWHQRTCAKAGRLTGSDSSETADKLQLFLDRHGAQTVHGAFYDGVRPDGHVTSAGSRLWPQTERLKSEAIRMTSDPSGIVRAVKAIAPYLNHTTRGLWHERRDGHGIFVPGPSPASSLYHLTEGILFAKDWTESLKTVSYEADDRA